jgi:unsaturated rhamnogalacturonyl hydrolase
MTRPSPHPTVAALAVIGLASVVTAFAQGTTAAERHFGSWPEGRSPAEIGRRVAKRFVEVPHQNFGRPGRPGRITYPEACTWWGALTFAKATGDEALKAALAARFEPLLAPVRSPGQADAGGGDLLDERDLVPVPDHVDHTVFAAVPLELYLQTQDRRYLELGQMMADWQWTSDPSYRWPFDHPILRKYFPDRSSPQSQQYIQKGLTWQTRLWIDDMFMITMAQAQAYRATGERKYVDRAAKEMVLYLDALQRPNGLFHHAPGVPFFWGRGNGWMAAGASELLRALPADSPDRPRILAGYKRMMESLLEHQDPDGMWHQLIDDAGSWPESSSTGMFAFAFISGVTEGWLDDGAYGPAARKAWLALTTYLTEDGDVREVCEGTNTHDPEKHGPDGVKYYNDRKRNVGDMHGQAPVLWCASALLR